MCRISGDRLVAFLIIDGVVYDSDGDHQECLEQYLSDTKQASVFTAEPGTAEYEEEHEQAVHVTYKMKSEHKAYGFDLFDAAGLDYVLVAHDRETLNANKQWAIKYCKENDTKLAYFTSCWDAELVDLALKKEAV